MGYHSPPEQKNTPIPAQKVPRRHSGQKKVSFPARNGTRTACRAGKHTKSRAEGAPEAFRAEKGIISCAEWDTLRLPGRKAPQFLRRRCHTNTSSTTIFLFLAKLLFLRKISRINLPYRFHKPFEIHRFAEQIIKL